MLPLFWRALLLESSVNGYFGTSSIVTSSAVPPPMFLTFTHRSTYFPISAGYGSYLVMSTLSAPPAAVAGVIMVADASIARTKSCRSRFAVLFFMMFTSPARARLIRARL
ncbi:MAG: hypothetical protein C5S52_00070 [ANME-2 cluster archaeon]|nr:hypothetical protein [ANME-2 cluster archaeon]